MIKELEEKRQGIIEINGVGDIYTDFELLSKNKIDNEIIKKILSKDFDFETIELIYDISIPEIVDNLFIKNKIEQIRYINTKELLRYIFEFKFKTTIYSKKESKRKELFGLTFVFDMNKETDQFCFHSGFFGNHDFNIEIAKSLIQSENKINRNKKIQIDLTKKSKIYAINGKIIREDI